MIPSAHERTPFQKKKLDTEQRRLRLHARPTDGRRGCRRAPGGGLEPSARRDGRTPGLQARARRIRRTRATPAAAAARASRRRTPEARMDELEQTGRTPNAPQHADVGSVYFYPLTNFDLFNVFNLFANRGVEVN